MSPVYWVIKPRFRPSKEHASQLVTWLWFISGRFETYADAGGGGGRFTGSAPLRFGCRIPLTGQESGSFLHLQGVCGFGVVISEEIPEIAVYPVEKEQFQVLSGIKLWAHFSKLNKRLMNEKMLFNIRWPGEMSFSMTTKFTMDPRLGVEKEYTPFCRLYKRL